MRNRVLSLLPAAVAGTVFFSAGPAAADPPSPATYEQQQVPPAQQYPAPLSQTTQPSYVPQSVAMSGPREIRSYEAGDPIPPGYRPVERTRRGLIVGGAVLFGTLYFISALAAAIDADNGKGELAPLWVPGVGPFIQMFSTDSATGKLFLGIDGVGQSAGLFMLVYGLTARKTVLVRNDLAKGPEKPGVTVAPLVGAGTSGLALRGTF